MVGFRLRHSGFGTSGEAREAILNSTPSPNTRSNGRRDKGNARKKRLQGTMEEAKIGWGKKIDVGGRIRGQQLGGIGGVREERTKDQLLSSRTCKFAQCSSPGFVLLG